MEESLEFNFFELSSILNLVKVDKLLSNNLPL